MTYNEPSGESGGGGGRWLPVMPGMKQQDGSEEDKCLHYLTSHLPVCYPSRLSSFRCENISSWGSVCLTICMSVFSQVCLSELKVKQNSKLLVSLSPLSLLDLRYIEDSRIYWPLCRLSGRLKLKKQFLTTKSNRLVKKTALILSVCLVLAKYWAGCFTDPSHFPVVFTFLKFCRLFRRTIATDWPMHFKQLKKPVGKISNEENGSELKYARNAIILVG